VAARQRLGQDVGQGAVIDLGAQYAGADHEGDHRDHQGQAESDDHRLTPVAHIGAEGLGQQSQSDDQYG
jgi:hypothetical protein